MKTRLFEALVIPAFFFAIYFGWPWVAALLGHLSLQIPAAVSLCAFAVASAFIISNHIEQPQTAPNRIKKQMH